MAQDNIQEQVKVLQSHCGGMAKLVKDLLSRIKSLEEKDLIIADGGTKETVENQQVIKESISENSNAVKRLEKEIKSMETDRNKKENNKKEVEEAIKRLDDEILLIKKDAKKSEICMEASELGDKMKKEIRCRYFNYGFCKYKEKCRFVHPKEVCGT
jgi:translation initiation factor 2B subunit (eIF-2B alpha/beta/delta family)